MKITQPINQNLIKASTICLTLLLAISSISYGQFVEKKKTDSTKTVKKEVKKEPVKPITNSIVKVVREEAYDIPKKSFGVQVVPQLGNPLLLEISPFIALRLGKKTLGALGLTYAFQQASVNGVSNSASHFGARTFIQYYPTKYLFAHGEIEGMSLEVTTSTTDPTTGLTTSTSNRETAMNINVGGGIRFPISSKFALQALLLYDMNRRTVSARELHGNPVFRVVVTF